MTKPALTSNHWALITDVCGITTTLTFTGGVVMQHVSRTAAVTTVSGVVLGGVVTLIVILLTHEAHGLAAVTAGWTTLVAGWLTYAHIHRDVWALQTWRWLIIPAVVLTGYTIVASHRHVTSSAEVAAAARRHNDAEKLAWWGNLLARCGVEDARATKISSSGRGRSVTLELSGRTTLRTLQSATDVVAVALRVAPGAVTFEQGTHAGEVVLQIDDHNDISAELPYPDDRNPLTVTEPLPIGMLPSGQPATITASMSTLVTGATGSGKTNLLNVLIAQLTRCPDVIVFVIDLKGGRLAAPWIIPWVEGRCAAPAVDWVATTRCEAALMLAAIDELITDRGARLAGGRAKARASRDLPHFVVIVDEMADVTGDLPRGDWEGVSPRDMAERGAKVTRKARSEAVSTLWATQKGTIDFTGSSAIKSQCRQRLSLGTASESDARSVTDNQAVVRLLASAAFPGVVVVEAPGQRDAVLTKAFRLDADDDGALIDRLAQRAGQTRPAPDAGALAVLGDRYAERWDRSGLYQLLLADFHARTGQAPLPEPPAPRQSAPPDRTVAQVAAIDVSQEAAELLRAAGLGGGRPDPEGRMWSLLADKRTMGLSVIEIMWAFEREGLSAHRSTVYRWLAKAEQDGKVRRSGDSGDATRWVLT